MRIAPIPLGPKKTPIDLTEWNRRCIAALGRTMPLGTQLSADELEALGFIHAASSPEVWRALREAS